MVIKWYIICFLVFELIFFIRDRKYMNISISYCLEKYFLDVEYKFDLVPTEHDCLGNFKLSNRGHKKKFIYRHFLNALKSI